MIIASIITFIISLISIGFLFLIDYNNTNTSVFKVNSKGVMSSNLNFNENNNMSLEILDIHKYNSNDNKKMNIKNMFPGDVETKYYCVRVSYKNNITLKYSANIVSKYKELANVLRIKIIVDDDKVLYDGLLKNIPMSIDYNISSNNSTIEEIYYKIVVSLDNTIGNEYQSKEMMVDFNWWVDDELEYIVNPQTRNSILFFVITASISLIAIVIILSIIWKERKNNCE